MTNSDTDISSPGTGIPADASFSQIQADDETTHAEYVAVIPILGGTAYISESGVTISRIPAAQIYLDPETKIDRDSIRGWSRTDPTPLEPGFINLFLDGTPPTSRQRSQFAPNVLRFSPAHSVDTSIIDFANEALTAMQADDLESLRRIARAVSHQTDSRSAFGGVGGTGERGNSTAGPSSEGNQAKSTEKKQDGSSSAPDNDASHGGLPQAADGTLDSRPPSFIAFDVETANEANGSICQFGVVVYHEGKEAESHTWLCQPPSAWPDFTPATTAIHGITPDKVADEPSCHDRLEQLAELQSMAEVVESAGYTFGTVKNNSLSLFRKTRRSRSDHQQSSRNGKTRGNRGPSNWESVATPRDIPETNTDANPNGPLFGKNVTLTGEFSPLDKGQLWQAIAQAGGTVGKNVTKKTTLLVCGEWNGKTSKQKRAEELQEKGQEIEIWNQGQLLDALDLN